MYRITALAALLAGLALAQEQSGPRNLDFEEGRPGDVPAAWFAPKSIAGYTAKLAAENPKSGKQCAEIAFTGDDHPSPFGNLMQSFDAAPYQGKRVRFRAAVRVTPGEDPATQAQLWLRVDRPSNAPGFFDNMNDRPIHASEWQYHEITGTIDSDAARLNIGVMLLGKGKLALDDVSLEILPALPTYAVPSTASYARLVSAAKLWVYIKYFHTRVTAPEIDWDQAFVAAAPKILESNNDEEFAAALNQMLAPLHDPTTRVLPFTKEDPRFVLAVHPDPSGVRIVRLESGTPAQATAARDAIAKQLAGTAPILFDLRGSYLPPGWLDSGFPAGAPATARRVHSGYTAQRPGSPYGGYYSAWETRDTPRTTQNAASRMRAVFLVDGQTSIPNFALAAQNSGAGAIVSEGPGDENALVSTTVPTGKLLVAVRTRELEAPVAPNLILNQTGDAALNAAIEIARSGRWPSPAPRSALKRSPAVFTEKAYPNHYPSTELRLLAAARIWGVYNYFHPYKYLYGEDWDAVLAEFLPKFAAAKDALEYHLAVARMIAHTHDTHCFVSSPELYGYLGTAAPIEIRWIENQPVVTRVVDPKLENQVHPGDVVTKINGEPPQKRIDAISPLFAASTPQSLYSRVMGYLLSGPAGVETPVTFRGADGKEHEVLVPHDADSQRKLYPYRTGETFRLLEPGIGYVDLQKLTSAQIDAMFDAFSNTKAFIMDMRGYPQGTAWMIASRLAATPNLVDAQFRTNIVGASQAEGGDVHSEMFEQRIPMNYQNKPLYKGKTILLIDERAISQSEHSGLMYKTANGTTFIGTPTAGANGDITGFNIPGGISVNFSGHDVRWPDGKQLQRVGLIPDIEVKPTIEGIRQGKDEVLDRAVEVARDAIPHN